MNLCFCGCGEEGIYQFKNGKFCCNKNPANCKSKRVICKICNKLFNKANIKKHLKYCEFSNTCLYCGSETKNPNYCNNTCAALHTAPGRKHTKETKKKISKGVLKATNGRKISLKRTVKTKKLFEKKYNKKNIKEKIYKKYLYECKWCKKVESTQSPNKKFCSSNCANKYHSVIKRSNMNKWNRYKTESAFKFNVYKYPTLFNIDFLKEHGWYHPVRNPKGISRDHMISVRYGFDNEIPVWMIAHQANCKLLLHTQNQKKNIKCSINLNELKQKIKTWEINHET